jgi:hypothetical protein
LYQRKVGDYFFPELLVLFLIFIPYNLVLLFDYFITRFVVEEIIRIQQEVITFMPSTFVPILPLVYLLHALSHSVEQASSNGNTDLYLGTQMRHQLY